MSYEILSVGDKPVNLAPTEPTEPTPSPTEPTEPNPAPVEPQPSEPAPTEEPPKEPTEPPKEGEPEYYFGEAKVEVEVPADIEAALSEKGIDSKQLLSELFAKDGKFELSADNRAKLDEAFGKTMVDGYLNLFKSQNEMTLSKLKAEQEAATAEQAKNSSEFGELVGGDEGWSELDNWASQNMSEQELASFNAVMSLPPEHWVAQKAVIQAIQMRRTAAQGDTSTDAPVKLIGDDSGAGARSSEGMPSTLTRDEFQQIMMTEKYRTDRGYAAKIDAIRSASIAKKI